MKIKNIQKETYILFESGLFGSVQESPICISFGSYKDPEFSLFHRDDYHGGESTSLNQNQLWKAFKGGDKPHAELGSRNNHEVGMVHKGQGISSS
ncbi:putative GDP dissociation inhibitor [Helianthus annuus]|nr:putative GDP dissociation inhibitor [Helianthus annuus]KAJ0731083.1 putative GDP dissociation inhibitor [Helianthus annuus]KAJ0770735.1 putative GDP dissociation inhibitor [Helianthus annuus]